jgi:hypothetical protein
MVWPPRLVWAQAAGDPHVGDGDDQPGYDAVEAFEPQAYVGGVVAFPAQGVVAAEAVAHVGQGPGQDLVVVVGVDRGEGAARRRPNFSR